MFATGYFGAAYFGPRYFGKAGAVAAVASDYFGAAYFGPRYFGGYYFGPGAAAPPVATSDYFGNVWFGPRYWGGGYFGPETVSVADLGEYFGDQFFGYRWFGLRYWGPGPFSEPTVVIPPVIILPISTGGGPPFLFPIPRVPGNRRRIKDEDEIVIATLTAWLSLTKGGTQ